MQDNLDVLYNNEFYNTQAKASYESALAFLGAIKDLLPPMTNIIDVGCGVGTWLKAWQDIVSGVKILGVDGNNVDADKYYIPLDCYKQVDLTQKASDLLPIILKDTNFYRGGGQ